MGNSGDGGVLSVEMEEMPKIYLKRVYTPSEATDGYRVLVDKLWPRGVRKENLQYDLWAKDIAPSTQLRKWFHESKDEHWSVFAQKYREELNHNPAMDDFMEQIKAKEVVTLLYASNNVVENHAVVLKGYVEGAAIHSSS